MGQGSCGDPSMRSQATEEGQARRGSMEHTRQAGRRSWKTRTTRASWGEGSRGIHKLKPAHPVTVRLRDKKEKKWLKGPRTQQRRKGGLGVPGRVQVKKVLVAAWVGRRRGFLVWRQLRPVRAATTAPLFSSGPLAAPSALAWPHRRARNSCSDFRPPLAAQFSAVKSDQSVRMNILCSWAATVWKFSWLRDSWSGVWAEVGWTKKKELELGVPEVRVSAGRQLRARRRAAPFRVWAHCLTACDVPRQMWQM